MSRTKGHSREVNRSFRDELAETFPSIRFKPEFPEVSVEWNAPVINRVPLLTLPQSRSFCNFIKRAERSEARTQSVMGTERARGKLATTEDESGSAVPMISQ